MSVITPKDLAGKSFSSAFKGYNKTEVDEYVSKVTKNYSVLYRRCAELEESLAVANLRLENIANDERRAKKALESAKEKSDCMIAEAYERADDILVAIKKNCDAILRDFRNKVDAQKDALAEMNARVEIFKKDVFAKYRTHIEMLEQLTPQLDFDEGYSSNEYVMRVIDELKHEINAEYDIAVGYDEDEEINGFEGYAEEPDFEEMPTEEEISAFINDLAKKAVEEPPVPALAAAEAAPEPAVKEEPAPAELPAPQEKAQERAEAKEAEAKETEARPAEAQAEPAEAGTKAEQQEAEQAPEPAAEPKAEEPTAEQEALPKEEPEKTIVIPSNKRSSGKRSTKKKKKQLNSVLEMLREYEEDDARKIPKIEAQLMFDFDEVTDSLIESPKK